MEEENQWSTLWSTRNTKSLRKSERGIDWQEESLILYEGFVTDGAVGLSMYSVLGNVVSHNSVSCYVIDDPYSFHLLSPVKFIKGFAGQLALHGHRVPVSLRLGIIERMKEG